MAQRGLFLAPFDELADPRRLARLAAAAEERGWAGFFLWDHIAYPPPVRGLADVWVALSAIACSTTRLRLGPMVTPLSRRRVQKVARETVTLDQLSDGRLTMGVGLGSDWTGELAPFGEPTDARQRADLLDQGLARLAAYWAGDFEPRPVQQPRIPVWVAARWPNRRPVRRAARWDGLFAYDLSGPEQLAELAAEVKRDQPYDIVVTVPPGGDPDPWAEAGATWVLTGFGAQPREPDVRAAIDDGPG